MRQVGARDMEFDIDAGIGTFLPKEGEPVDLSGIRRAVREAGFDLLWLEARVRGSLRRAVGEADDVRLAVVVPSTGQRFVLVEGGTEEERRGYARLIEWLEAPGRAVEVRGRAHPHEGAPSALTVREYRLLE